jgi:hypothetical protein
MYGDEKALEKRLRKRNKIKMKANRDNIFH